MDMKTGKSGLSLELTEIGPEDAQALLEMNIRNRSMNENRVRQYVHEMRQGAWGAGSQIQLSENGVVVDGQHRLQAVINSGTVQVFSVLWGVTLAHQDVVDTQQKRTIAGQLSIRGVQGAQTAAAIIRPTMRWDRGGPGLGAFNASSTGAGLTVNYPSIHDAVRFYEENKGEIESARLATDQARKATKGRTPAIGLLALLAGRINVEDRDDFFDKLTSGAGLDSGHPILALRKRYADDSAAKGGRPISHVAAETIKVWNAYRDGLAIKTLRWTSGGANPEPFPTPR